MDSRKIYILTQLNFSPHISARKISSNLKISDRILKTEVRELNELFDMKLITIDNDELYVNDNSDFREKSSDIINELNFLNYRLNREERLLFELLMLSVTKEYLTVDKIIKVLYASRSTVIGDLKDLKNDLVKFKIEMESQRNHGFKLNGDPENFYLAIKFAINNLQIEYNSFIEKGINQILYDGINFTLISKSLLDYTKSHNFEVSDTSFNEALLLTAIYIKRIAAKPQKRNKEEVNNDLLEKCISDNVKSTNIDERIKKSYYSQLKLIFLAMPPMENNDDSERKIRISSFIWKVCQNFNIINLFGYANYKNLFNHIELTIQYLSENKNIIPNPFCSELKHNYPEIFKCIQHNLYIIQDLVDNKIDENAVSYIVMHIASVIEGRKLTTYKLSADVVCPSGRCTSLLLKARILKQFDIRIVEVIPAYQVNENLDVDFIISTIPLKISSIPVVTVNQMLTASDIELLNETINRLISEKKERQILQDIQCYFLQKKQGQDIVFSEIMDNTKLESDKNYYYRCLKPENMILDLQENDWEKAVRKSGELLLKDGTLTKDYIDKMVELVEVNGPYIVFSPGFVIAHAGPKDGANKLGVSLIRLAHPIDFGIKEIPVRFVICLSIPNEIDHVFLLFQIYKCMCNREVFKCLASINSKSDFIQIIKIFEKSLTEDENNF